MILALILVPAVAGLLAFVIRADGPRRALLVAATLAHAAMTARAVLGAVAVAAVPEGWLALDPVGLLFLGITSALFLAASVYGVGYLAREARQPHREMEGSLVVNAPEAVFTGCFLFFLSTMTLVTLSHHFGLLWVGIEATTLATAPLIYFHRHHRSLEAAWKYLLICSVGIALALLGNFFLAVAATREGAGQDSLLLEVLLNHAGDLNVPWLKVAFLCLLVGYGTKMGLAPMHAWLPDAHSESPSVISALLSGALLNCAFLGILRAQQVLGSGGPGALRPGTAGRVRPGFDGSRGHLHSAPAGLQTDAGLFECGAHGDTGTRRRSRGSGHLRRAAPLHQPLAGQGHAFPGGREHPGSLSDQVHHRRERRRAHSPHLGGAVGRGISGDHRFPAVRPVPERVHDSARGPGSAAHRGSRGLPGVAGADLRRDGIDCPPDGAGLALRGRGKGSQGAGAFHPFPASAGHPGARAGSVHSAAVEPCAARDRACPGRFVMAESFRSAGNGEAIPVAEVPVVDFPAFRETVLGGADSAGTIPALFGRAVPGGPTRITAVIAHPVPGMLRLVSTDVKDAFPSLTRDLPEVHLFEREIAEQHGVEPEDHPWLKPVRFPASTVGVTNFFHMEGEEVHEVAVGPVHAGIIEPGHFRFQCHGENVFHLEISLGYQHRGVERGSARERPTSARSITWRRLPGTPRSATPPRTARPSRLSRASGRPTVPRPCARSRSSWSAWPTTRATWGRWRTMSVTCRRRPTAAASAATFST